jgi:hypothetical protein
MYTSKSLKLTSKLTKILELIHEVNNRSEFQRSELHRYDHADSSSLLKWFYNREHYLGRIEKLKAVKSRLMRYYENTLHSLIVEGFRHGITFDNQIKETVCN